MRQVLKNFIPRVEEVAKVLEQSEKWNQTEGHQIERRLDLNKIAMSGHSFGARTTQAVGGQTFKAENAQFSVNYIIAALPMSPSSPERFSREAFGNVSIPWMLMTGTKDTVSFGNNSDAKSRLAVFPALPPNGKYELVLFGAEHSAFTDQDLNQSLQPCNPNQHRAILALSTAFWDSYLRTDTAARNWLDGVGHNICAA